VADVPDDKSMRKLKEGGYSAERKIMPNFGKTEKAHQRARRVVRHGIQRGETALHNIPRCGAKMEEDPNRRVKCQCGFTAHRDEVPIYLTQR